MPVHDWTRVEEGIFHAFHTTWMGAIQNAMNGGLLPDSYYALAEQHFGRPVADVLTLHASPAYDVPLPPLPEPAGGLALAEAPPRVHRRQSFDASAIVHGRSLAVRHVSGHRLIALLEIVSPANEDRESHVADLADKARQAMANGVNLVLVDLLPPGPHDRWGMHAEVLSRMDLLDVPYELPGDQPLTVASYVAGPRLEVFANHLAIGQPIPETPLFLTRERYVNVPLEETYLVAYRGMPAFWRDVLEGRPATG